MHCVRLVVRVASKLLPTELLYMGQIWEEREVGEFAPAAPVSWLCCPGLVFLHTSWGVGVRTEWWDWKAEPAESKDLKPALTLSAVRGPFACEGNRFPEAGL